MLGSPLRYSSGGGWYLLPLVEATCLFWESRAHLGRNCEVQRHVRAARSCREVVTSRSQGRGLGRAVVDCWRTRTVRRGLMTSATCHTLSWPSGALPPCSPACRRTAFPLVPISRAAAGGLVPSSPPRGGPARVPAPCTPSARGRLIAMALAGCLQPPMIERRPLTMRLNPQESMA